MHIQSLLLPRTLHVLHALWYYGVVGASMLFGLLLASPWMALALDDPRAWIVVAIITVATGGLFKAITLSVVRWARNKEYGNWVQWCQGPRASTVVGQAHQKQRARQTLEQAWQRDVQALAGAGLAWPGTWLRQGDIPAVHDMTAGEVRVLRRLRQRAGLPCHTWEWGDRVARKVRWQMAEAVSARWQRRFGQGQE